MALIKGGYYIKAKCIQESDVARMPPCVREIWDYILLRANWKDGKPQKDFKRGQVRLTYKDIMDGLHWMVGWRKTTYSKWDCERAMKALTKATMIATSKTTKGLIITVLNYAKFQNPENYEERYEGHRPATDQPQSRHTIEEEVKKGRNITNKEKTNFKETGGWEKIGDALKKRQRINN